MQCRNCGATIHEGDTFCRTCGFTVETSSIPDIDSKNVAMNDFMAPSKKEQAPTTVHYDETITKVVEPKVSAPDNKVFIKKDGNDRIKATILNFLGLAVLIIIVIIIGIILYKSVFQHIS